MNYGTVTCPACSQRIEYPLGSGQHHAPCPSCFSVVPLPSETTNDQNWDIFALNKKPPIAKGSHMKSPDGQGWRVFAYCGLGIGLLRCGYGFVEGDWKSFVASCEFLKFCAVMAGFCFVLGAIQDRRGDAVEMERRKQDGERI